MAPRPPEHDSVRDRITAHHPPTHRQNVPPNQLGIPGIFGISGTCILESLWLYTYTASYTFDQPF